MLQLSRLSDMPRQYAAISPTILTCTISILTSLDIIIWGVRELVPGGSWELPVTGIGACRFLKSTNKLSPTTLALAGTSKNDPSALGFKLYFCAYVWQLDSRRRTKDDNNDMNSMESFFLSLNVYVGLIIDNHSFCWKKKWKNFYINAHQLLL